MNVRFFNAGNYSPDFKANTSKLGNKYKCGLVLVVVLHLLL